MTKSVVRARAWILPLLVGASGMFGGPVGAQEVKVPQGDCIGRLAPLAFA